MTRGCSRYQADDADIRAALPDVVPPVHVAAVTGVIATLTEHFLTGELAGWTTVKLNPVMIDAGGPQVLDIVLQGPRPAGWVTR